NDVSVTALGKTWLFVLAAALSAASDTAVGATLSVNVLSRTILTQLDQGAQLTATNGNVLVQAMGDNWALVLTLAASGAGSNALNGTIPVFVALDTVRSEAGYGSSLNAGGSVGVIANLNNHSYLVAGGLSVAGNNAIGATIATMVYLSTVESIINRTCVILSGGAGTGLAVPNRADKRRGVIISATAFEDVLAVAVSAAISGSVAVNGVINTVILRNVVHALVLPQANVTANGTQAYTVSENGSSETLSSGDVLVEGEDDARIINLAGSLSASGNVGFGATIVALVFDKTVTASVASDSRITAKGSIRVRAYTKDQLFLLAIAFGAAGTAGIAGGANALVFQNAVTAELGGTATAGLDVIVSAGADSLLVNAAFAVGGGGTAGVTAIALITYFYQQTNARILTGARVTATAGDIEVHATSSEIVTADAAGVAIGGTAGVGGTLDIIVTKVVTKAYTESYATLRAGGDVSILASDSFNLIAVVITIGAAGVAGVGVSALVSVSFNTIEASIGAGSRVTASGAVIVSASSNRDVLSFVTSVGGGGAAGVGVSLSIIVTGNKLSQDAHDNLYAEQVQEQFEHNGKVYYVYLDKDGNRLYELRESGSKALYRLSGDTLSSTSYSDTKTPVMVDSNAMDPQEQTQGVFDLVDSRAGESQPEDSLTDLLAGDGQNASSLDPGSSGYGQSEDGDESAMNDDTYDDTVDGSKLHSSRIGDLSDSTSAVIRAGAVVTAQGGDLSVLSGDSVNANMIAGSFGVGGYAGVGVGIAVSVLFSNVNALVEAGAVLSAPNGGVIVRAASGATSQDIENINDDTKSVNDSVLEKISPSDKSTIRLIAVTGGGGLVGVGVTLAALLVFSEVNAILAGDVSLAKSVLVRSDINFGEAITVTLAISGGFVGVSVSGGITFFSAKVQSAIAGSARLSDISQSITVSTVGNTNAISAASSIGGGAVAVNAGMALVLNFTRVDTYIGQGVNISASGAAVRVETQYTANAKAFTIAVSVGGVAVGATLAVVVNLLDANTYLGITPSGTTEPGSYAAQKGSILAGSVTVNGMVTNATTVLGVGVAGGSVAVNGIVALGFNWATNRAAIWRANVEASTISVTAILTGDTTVITTSLAIGSVAVGATIALAQISTQNIAAVDLTGVTVHAGTLNISAGTSSSPTRSQALVTMVTGTAGTAAIALNIAVAINAATNTAALYGDQTGTLAGNHLNISADGVTRAYAIIANVSVAGLAVNISFALATLSSTQNALVQSTSAITLTGNMMIVSHQNTAQQTYSSFLLQITDRLTDTISGRFTTMAQAYIFSASAGVVSLQANTVVATANATGRAKVTAANLAVLGALGVYSYGASTAGAKVDNITFAYAAAGLMVGYAYAAGTFEAILISTGTVSAGSVTVYNSFTSDATSDLTPAAGGLQAGAYDLGVNISLAESKTIAKAYLTGGVVKSTGAVVVSSRGIATANAVVRGAAISITGVKVALNESYASVSATQDSYISNVSLEAGSVGV
ncbi:MAG: hypothetical protein ABFC56_06225, partial [Clostridiaceae bacterium]